MFFQYSELCYFFKNSITFNTVCNDFKKDEVRKTDNFGSFVKRTA